MLYDGIGRQRRRTVQYNEVVLRRMLSIGATCSTGGARAPISEVATDLRYEVGRSSVDLFIFLIRRSAQSALLLKI